VSGGLGEFAERRSDRLAAGRLLHEVRAASMMGASCSADSINAWLASCRAYQRHHRRGQAPVSLLVLVNAMIPTPGETPGDWWTNTGQPQARRDKDVRDGRPADAGFDLLTYFFHDVSQHVIDEA
jgi:hypothetical protein